jgi:hypothetical protein
MIAGLKHRRDSNTYYDIVIVVRQINNHMENFIGTRWDYENDRMTVHFIKEPYVTRDTTRTCGWAINQQRMVWRKTYLFDKICDYVTPNDCKNSNCPHRFTCFTHRIKIEET